MYKVLIRPLVVEDANTSWRWRNDSEVWALTGNRPDKPITLDIEIDWIKKVINDRTTKRFAITADDQYVGNVQLTDITDSEAQFHIFIGEKSFWGKGIANQATYQILNYAKEILKLSEVYLYVHESNVIAIKVYEKNSFKIEGQDCGEIKMTCRLIDLKAPKVSIFCMVYNHEEHISDAIEGFLMQKNNFNTVIVIGEDCSTDNSKNVINSFVERFPGKFKLIYQNINIGATKNQEIVLQNCVGKYVAICEGDDYWTDPLKLQKQVDFLEANEDYVITYGKIQPFSKQGFINKKYGAERDLLNSELIKCTPINTLTVCFRNIINEFPKEMNQSSFGDLFLWSLLGQFGKGKFLKEIKPSMYRVHEGGVFSMQDSKKLTKMWFNTSTALFKYYSRVGKMKYAFYFFTKSLRSRLSLLKKTIIN